MVPKVLFSFWCEERRKRGEEQEMKPQINCSVVLHYDVRHVDQNKTSQERRDYRITKQTPILTME